MGVTLRNLRIVTIPWGRAPYLLAAKDGRVNSEGRLEAYPTIHRGSENAAGGLGRVPRMGAIDHNLTTWVAVNGLGYGG